MDPASSAFNRRRTRAWVVLVACVGAGLAWLLHLDFRQKISSDILDLIPARERAPEAALVRTLANDVEARTMLFVLTKEGGGSAPTAAAQRFAAELLRSPVFAKAIAIGDPAWRDALGRELFALRLPLLFPGWLEAHPQGYLPATIARNLRQFLERPEAVAFQDLIPADPLLLMPDALERMKDGLTIVPAASAAGEVGLVWAELAVRPLDEAGQGPAFAAVERALAATRTQWPGLRMEFTGVNRLAAASRARIEREVSWLNALSLVAVLGVAAVFIRQLHRSLHLVPVIGFAVLGAWVAVTVVFARVHVIVLVLGALLTGVAIDYGFYLFMQPPAGPDEDYPSKVRRLAKPLIASCATTVVGFALLLWSELPVIRQLGLFVGAGLVSALCGAVLYFSTVRNPFLPARPIRLAHLSTPWRRRLRFLLLAGWVVAALGLVRLTWHDDVRELEVPAPMLRAEDARVRAAFGQRADRTVYLTHGSSVDEAREGWGKLVRWLGPRAKIVSLAGVVPSAPARAAAARFAREHPSFASELRAALETEGFSAEEFEPFFKAWATYAATPADADFTPTVVQLRGALAGPLSALFHVGAEQTWFVTLARDAPVGAPPAETRTLAASQLESLNRLFTNYRASALRLSCVGLAVVGLGVFLTYGLRDGVRIFAIPCGACLGLFGLFGWLGQPLNLFHLLGAFLGVCLTHNYSIFSATSAYRGEATPISVRLSALTTAASFGVLALSGIPVVQALGTTVAGMVIVALTMIELEHLAPLGRQP